MNDLVKTNIEARKTAILNSYEIKEQAMIDKIDELFNKINEFGENCIDSSDFETKFASSPLNQEYINIFTEVVTNCKQKELTVDDDTSIKTDEEYILEDVASEIKYQAESATQPLRRKATQEVFDKARDIPVVGEVLNVKQHIDFFSKFKTI